MFYPRGTTEVDARGLRVVLPSPLVQLCDEQVLESRHGITLDWLYEAKMMYGLVDWVASGRFARGSTVVAVLS